MFILIGACWLNLQEGWWRLFRKAALAGQTFADPDEITYANRLATAHLNAPQTNGALAKTRPPRPASPRCTPGTAST